MEENSMSKNKQRLNEYRKNKEKISKKKAIHFFSLHGIKMKQEV